MTVLKSPPLDHVDYDTLDRAKRAFIEAGKKTLSFASKYGFIPDARFGASANVFALDLKPFLAGGADRLYVTLVPEGLGTADDARPDDLTEKEQYQFWHNIGIKTVAVTTNDVASAGMQPVLLSLYLPSCAPEIVFHDAFMKGFLDGFVEGCRMVGCVYFSGETPQLKTKLHQDKIDIAGAVFGVMPPGYQPINATGLRVGDRIVMVESSGPHENGFTSLRKLAESLPHGYRTKLPDGTEYWEALNAPSVLYTPLVQDVIAAGITLSNIEPITGHGWQKLMRTDKPFKYVIERMLPVLPVFEFVQEQTHTTATDMLKIFNYGSGLALFTHTEREAGDIVAIARKRKLKAVIAGHIEESPQRLVEVRPLGVTLTSENFALKK